MYFITAINSLDYQSAILIKRLVSSRCFGYFPLLNLAEDAIKKNLGNLHETIYNFLIVEEIDFGIHPLVKKEIWFQWSEWDKTWKTCFKPSWSEGVINWALG